MKVLTRYLLRAHLGPFLFAFLALTGIILINTVAKDMAGLAGKGIPARVMAEYFLLSLPANIALALPMAVLVSVLYTFSQMSSENEIIALKASGIDLRRVAMPLVLVATLLAGFMIWFNDRALPAANYRWRMLMVDVAQTSPLLVLREQTINPIRSTDGTASYFLQAGSIDPATSRLRDISIYDVSDPRVNRTIYADSGRMALNAARTDLVLTLFDGDIREINLREPSAFQRAEFQRQVLRMAGVSQRLQRTSETTYRTDRDMTIAMMNARVDTLGAELAGVRTELAQMPPRPEAVDAAQRPADPVGYAERTRLENRRETLLEQMRSFRFEIHKKYAIAVASLVFVLIGIPLALRFPTGGVGAVILISLSIFSIYYVGLIGGETLSDRGYLPPTWSAWVTNLIFGTLGLLGMLWVGRETGTDRTSWGEQARGWLRGLRRRRGRGEA